MDIFYNCNIFSQKSSPATALAIDQGRFIAIGSDDDILDAFNHHANSINLNGKTIWPGLTDAHLHLRHLAESQAMVNCETTTLEECLDRVKKAAEILPQGVWIRGHGWNQNRWESGFGNARLLDEVCKGHPAYLTAKSLHAAWTNTQALSLANIDDCTPNPADGIIQRDENGHPTGILFEAGAMGLVELMIPPSTHSELKNKFNKLFPMLWQSGLVGVHDFDGLDCWNVLQDLHQAGELKLRVRKNIPADHIDTFIEAGLRTDTGDDWLHLGGVKLFADGALGPQTAAMIDPYEHSTETGSLLLTEDNLKTIGQYAVDNGISLAVHAIGDLANKTVLNAFQWLRTHEREKEIPHLYHRIEHVQILDPEDLPRLAELDIVASVQPVHAPSDMKMAEKYLADRSKYAYAYRSMLDLDACLVFGSDSPVEPFNPFYGIHAAVTRRRTDGQPGIDGWYPEQRLSLTEALKGFSSIPAKISNRGSRLGSIEVGYKADFLILQEDPFCLDPHQMAEVKPEATFIEGHCMYQSPNSIYDFFTH